MGHFLIQKVKLEGRTGMARLEFINRKVLGGGFKYFLFSPLPGEMIQFD